MKELNEALRGCIAGNWGMFGQNDVALESLPKPLADRLRSRVAENLIRTGEEIRRLRGELGYAEKFWVFERYMQYRQLRSANLPGEPKLAAEFLAELESDPEYRRLRH